MDDAIKEVRDRLEACYAAQGESRQEMIDDLRFSNPANPEQWPEAVRRARERAPEGARPCLTFDQTNSYISQVVNDARQNKPSIKIRPVDSGADPKTAEALQGLFRHIEDASKADVAYDTALEMAARCGLGWLRVVPMANEEASEQQEIRILRVTDPLSVHLDPDWREADGSDAMFGFVEALMSRQKFKRLYPNAEPGGLDLGKYSGAWSTQDSVRVCEYFSVSETMTNQVQIDTGSDLITLPEAEAWEYAQRMNQPMNNVRAIKSMRRAVKWQKLNGQEILEETDFPAQFVPLIPCLGQELWIENRRYLSGMVRRVKDAQRVYNYERSAYVEMVALAPKAPFLADPRQIEGYERQWANANASNAAYLPARAVIEVNGVDQVIGMPQRQPPPMMPTAFLQGSELAKQDIKSAFGMFAANLGEKEGSQSGRAINSLQRQGDTANFHYTDNLSRSIRHLGRIVVEMIPTIYNERRIARILGEDGAESMVMIDPSQEQAHVRGKPGSHLQSIINPNVGRYDVTVKVGPAFASKRAEAAQAIADLTQGNPQLFALVGDVMVKMMDWPEANKIAARLKAMLPPQIRQMEDAEADMPPEAMQAIQNLQQQMQAQQQEAQQEIEMLADALGKAQEALEEAEQTKGDSQGKLELEELKLLIDKYGKDTERMKAEAEIAVKMSAVQEIETEAQEVANEGAELATLMAQVQALSAVVQTLSAPKHKQSRAVKQPDGSWVMESLETTEA